MSTWNIYKFNTGTLVYDSDGTIPRPNEDMDMEVISNQQKFKLADGSDAFVTPEIKSTKQPLNFIWYLQDDTTLKDKLETYMTNNDYLKIVTHTSLEFIGRFISARTRWLTGQTSMFEIQALFEVME